MGEAEGDLKPGGKGKGSAIGEQGRALEALREGAQGLQKQMQGEGGEGEGGVEATGKARRSEAKRRDPLGRDRNGDERRRDGRPPHRRGRRRPARASRAGGIAAAPRRPKPPRRRARLSRTPAETRLSGPRRLYGSRPARYKTHDSSFRRPSLMSALPMSASPSRRRRRARPGARPRQFAAPGHQPTDRRP